MATPEQIKQWMENGEAVTLVSPAPEALDRFRILKDPQCFRHLVGLKLVISEYPYQPSQHVMPLMCERFCRVVDDNLGIPIDSLILWTPECYGEVLEEF